MEMHGRLPAKERGDEQMIRTCELLHDIRMPLQLIYSCAQLLETEIGENERAQSHIRMLLGSAEQLQEMLTGALEQARPEAGRVRWQRSELVNCTWETFVRCDVQARRRGIQMSFHSNVDRLPTALDEGKYARILLNLLSNALKYTPEGGHVRVEIAAMNDFAEVAVADDGCGVAPDRLEKIFELHETEDGYGYGLFIARDYARRLGGTLVALSDGKNGSRFVLRLPVRGLKS